MCKSLWILVFLINFWPNYAMLFEFDVFLFFFKFSSHMFNICFHKCVSVFLHNMQLPTQGRRNAAKRRIQIVSWRLKTKHRMPTTSLQWYGFYRVKVILIDSVYYSRVCCEILNLSTTMGLYSCLFTTMHFTYST